MSTRPPIPTAVKGEPTFHADRNNSVVSNRQRSFPVKSASDLGLVGRHSVVFKPLSLTHVDCAAPSEVLPADICARRSERLFHFTRTAQNNWESKPIRLWRATQKVNLAYPDKRDSLSLIASQKPRQSKVPTMKDAFGARPADRRDRVVGPRGRVAASASEEVGLHSELKCSCNLVCNAIKVTPSAAFSTPSPPLHAGTIAPSYPEEDTTAVDSSPSYVSRAPPKTAPLPTIKSD
ncbi:MAG: hypothetical protein TREMPRED_005808 [Tremellales sp. Tagirdzhanova-0007]|nr:MAG: hypothetical protein TREMPRED_005808 [Tremellales sp. Tagirdzhanova-0007]